MPALACPRVLLAQLSVVCLGLMGCAALPNQEYADFVPLQTTQRQMEGVKIIWEVRDDAAAYCQQKQQSQGGTVQGTHVACAIWSVQKKECRIVTSNVVSHVVLGHEVRHCFEGHFHP